jgi:hypothetical protein
LRLHRKAVPTKTSAARIAVRMTGRSVPTEIGHRRSGCSSGSTPDNARAASLTLAPEMDVAEGAAGLRCFGLER